MCLTIKHLMAILCGLSISQAASATGSLCKHVLLFPTQAQIDSTIEAFTRLTMQVDEAQVMGNEDAAYHSLRASQIAKKQELLTVLHLTPEKLSELVKEKMLSFQKGKDTDRVQEAQDRKTMQDRIVLFELKTTFLKNTTGSTVRLEPNGKTIYVLNFVFSEAISLNNGSRRRIEHSDLETLKHGLFRTRHLQGKVNLELTDYKTRKLTVIESTLPGPIETFISNDKNSFLNYKPLRNSKGIFAYEQYDSKGQKLYADSVALPRDTSYFVIEYTGPQYWILNVGGQLYRFTPHNKKFISLKADLAKVAGVAGNKVVLEHKNKIQVMDLVSMKKETRKFPDNTHVVFANSEFMWVKEQRGDSRDLQTLRKISLTDINTDLEVRKAGSIFYMKEIPGTDWVTVVTNNQDGSFQNGIYSLHDMSMPLYNLNHVYSPESQRTLEEIWVADGGKRLVIYGSDSSQGQPRTFFDVLDLKQNWEK